MTWACIGGSDSIVSRTTSRVSDAARRSSGTPVQAAGTVDQWPAKVSPAPRKRSGSNDGASRSSPASDANGTLRHSRWPLVFAMLLTIRRIHVRSDERPSNRSMPCSTPSQASCTTSSATACEETYMRATRSIMGCRRSTR